MKEVIGQDGTFKFFIEAELQKSEDGKKWISGIASTSDEDLQGEHIKQDGLDLSYFLQRGFFNDDHAKETGAKVGIPTEAKVTKSGLWVKGFLLETRRAQQIYELAEALTKAGGARKLGFSVEGKVLSRDDKNPRIITKAWIKDIAITASPINPNTFLDIAKSLADADLTEVFVYGDSEDAVSKAGGAPTQPAPPMAPPQAPNPDEKEEEKDEKAEAAKRDTKEREKKLEAVGEELEALEDATKKPTSQTEEEKKDAEEAAKEALDDKHPKQDIEKDLPDVPVAKKAGKSMAKKSVEIEMDEEGNIILKGLNIKIKPEHNGIVEIEEGESDKEAIKTVAKEHKKAQEHAGGASEEKKVKKSEDETDLVKGFKKTHEVGGEKKHGDKKVPVHCTTYEHPSGHHIVVTGREGVFAVNHMHRDGKGKAEIIGSCLFHDDPKTGQKGKDELDKYLKGFGIKHKHVDKDSLLGKALTASTSDEKCDLCSSTIQKGDAFMVKEGKCICDESCLEKALVAGYSFAVTDQTGGSALRVESLEGQQRDMGYGQHLNVKAKEVTFDSTRANGGTTQVTLKDAVEFLMSRGLPEDMADRVLVLLIKNNGNISELANKAKSKGGK